MTDETKEAEPEPETEVESEFIPNSNFSIAIHTTLHNAQQSHGVPHKDYTQYRSYLTRRLARIRHAKPVIKSLSHGPKSKRESNANGSGNAQRSKKGGKHAFQPRDEITIQQATLHENYILDGLYSAERAWAHGMELKSVYEEFISTDGANLNDNAIRRTKKQTSPGKVRQHYLNRLKKSFDHVVALENIVISGVCDDRTCLELKCYAAWMKGNYYCEVNNWEVSSSILCTLSNAERGEE